MKTARSAWAMGAAAFVMVAQAAPEQVAPNPAAPAQAIPAQEAPKPAVPVQIGDAHRDGQPPSAAEELLKMAAELKLSADQQAKLKAIASEDAEAKGKLAVEYQAARSDQVNALRADNEAADRKAQETMRALADRRLAIASNALAKARAVVSGAQWQAWQAGQMADACFKTFENTALTDEQKGKIRSLCAETLPALETATDPAARTAAYRQLMEKIRSSILTQQQRDDAAAGPMQRSVMKRFPDADFTPEQKAKIKAICLAASQEASTSTNDRAPAAAFQKMRDIEKKVTDEVLTEAQRGSLEGSRLYRQISFSVGRCSPSPEQVARMKALCQDAAKGLTSTTDFTARSLKAKEVLETIKTTILTEEQRAKLPVPPAGALPGAPGRAPPAEHKPMLVTPPAAPAPLPAPATPPSPAVTPEPAPAATVEK